MAKRISDKRSRGWQIASVWVKRRDGPARVLNAYRLLLDLPPRPGMRDMDLLPLVPQCEKARGANH